MLEHNRNQDNGEPSAQPLGVELPPAIRADLLDPGNWQEGLATFARATNLAAACPSRERRHASVSPAPGVHLCQPLACRCSLHRMKLGNFDGLDSHLPYLTSFCCGRHLSNLTIHLRRLCLWQVHGWLLHDAASRTERKSTSSPHSSGNSSPRTNTPPSWKTPTSSTRYIVRMTSSMKAWARSSA